MHVQCTAQEENVRDTQSGQDSYQEKPREDVAWAERSAETYISDSKREGRKIPEPETWKKEEITVAVGVIKDDEEGVSLTPREPSQTTSMADIEFGDNLSGKEKCELTVVCLGLGDPKGIAISFSHRRPDRVVAVNTALKTVSTVGRLWDTEDRVRRNLASTRRQGAGREFLCGSRRRGLLIA
ncbi:hypothetical protein ACOMHN_007432 [Nucella lapillus]